MTLTKKQKKYALIILIGIIAIGVIIAFYIKINYFSVLGGANNIAISDLDYRTWSASAIGRQIIGSLDGKFNFVMHEPSENGAKQQMWCDKINSVTSEVCPSRGSVDGDSATSNWNFRVGTQYTNLLKDQFIILEGNLGGAQIKTYGLCTGFDCYVYDPSPENLEAISITSIKIYFKSGGYTEESGKLEFGLLPSGCYSHSDCPSEDLGLVCFEGNVTKKSSINLCVSGECSLSGYNYDLIETCENGCENAECKDKFNFIPISIIIGVIILLGGLIFVFYKRR